MKNFLCKIFCVALAFGLLADSSLAVTSITVVNIIPNEWSNETHQDSEPNLAVNSANPLQMAASAFTSGVGFCATGTAPIFVTTNEGERWAISCVIPSDENAMFSDISLRFAGSTNNLYVGILRHPGEFRLNILRTNNLLSHEGMAILVDREQVDQPYVQATTIGGEDRVYVGANDFRALNGQTATIDFSRTAHLPVHGFGFARIESRSTARQNGPAVRTAVHPDGTTYAIFYGWRAMTGTFEPNGMITTDVVVVRENSPTASSLPFSDLKDPDGLSGIRVARERRVPWNNSSQSNFGNERFVCSNLSIAVDPRPGHSNTVYIAWADRVGEDDYTLHVRRTTDRGATWSDDLRTITNATNPALAVSEQGTVGFLYQQLTRADDSQRWETHLELTAPDAAFGNAQNFILATVPANKPDAQFIPYIGDYIHLMTVGNTFYGIFSANNTPELNNFPNRVIYQRNVNLTTKQLLRTDRVSPVAPSIDPFFFKVVP